MESRENLKGNSEKIGLQNKSVEKRENKGRQWGTELEKSPCRHLDGPKVLMLLSTLS